MEEMDTMNTLIIMSWEIEQLRTSGKPFAEVKEVLIGLAAILLLWQKSERRQNKIKQENPQRKVKRREEAI